MSIYQGWTLPTEYEKMNHKERAEWRQLQTEIEQARRWAEEMALDEDVIREALALVDIAEIEQDLDHLDWMQMTEQLRHGG